MKIRYYDEDLFPEITDQTYIGHHYYINEFNNDRDDQYEDYDERKQKRHWDRFDGY